MNIKLFTIPNCITLLNLLCGMGSIVASLVYEDLTLAFIFVGASAVCDFLDGFSARLLKQYSEVGVQLDSLADMVSFGVAPAVAMSVLCGEMPSVFGLNELWAGILCYVPFLIAAFSALRLAKFNIDDTQHEEFCGLPTPASAILCLSLACVCERYDISFGMEWLLLISVLVAVLLVSPIRMFSLKFKEWGLGNNDNKVRYGFLLTSCLLICLVRLYAIPVIIVLYIVISTIRWFLSKR
ncbi:MAG: CDP-alcohol phosphatidyltransferase family protein [Alistipes sp.]|nr:CDP-alcohol phosphatidyltransferase family protein [Alistipes sp.]